MRCKNRQGKGARDCRRASRAETTAGREEGARNSLAFEGLAGAMKRSRDRRGVGGEYQLARMGLGGRRLPGGGGEARQPHLMANAPRSNAVRKNAVAATGKAAHPQGGRREGMGPIPPVESTNRARPQRTATEPCPLPPRHESPLSAAISAARGLGDLGGPSSRRGKGRGGDSRPPAGRQRCGVGGLQRTAADPPRLPSICDGCARRPPRATPSSEGGRERGDKRGGRQQPATKPQQFPNVPTP